MTKNRLTTACSRPRWRAAADAERSATKDMKDNNSILPTWAPRVAQDEIRRLYESDAAGIYDQELIDQVGYGLLMRCESFLAAMEATQGKARCPRCATIVQHAGRKDEELQCPCGWRLPWSAYFKTIQHKQLSGAEPVLALFRTFVQAYPATRDLRARMLLIDQLIHGFHWYLDTGPTRPVAVNLIEGRLGEVVAFLEALSYGERGTPGLQESRVEWDKNIDVNRHWYPTRRDNMAEQPHAADAGKPRR
jgi:hypothetical protein